MELQTEKQIEQQYIDLEVDKKGYVVFMQMLNKDSRYIEQRLRKLQKVRKSKEEGQKKLKEIEDRVLEDGGW
ncbi:hypothetical protein GLW05_20925 [Pontibacillus yanchengensis]|uniref:Uncharacterized protein n=1 Tax=Pontibacillus yanchengensis TaxID=462910 RepID=A0A6I5A738_9BACI|nr:hypothetical protein [Pontibacillus yanchengensis]MYL36038.1 hypothetical protein [Pontibacillus yanchengensis]